MELSLLGPRQEPYPEDDVVAGQDEQTPSQVGEVAPAGEIGLVPRRDAHQLNEAARDVPAPAPQHHLHRPLVHESEVQVPSLRHPDGPEVEDRLAGRCREVGLQFAVEGRQRHLDVGQVGVEPEVGGELAAAQPGARLQAHLDQLHRLPSPDHSGLEGAQLEEGLGFRRHLDAVDDDSHGELVCDLERPGGGDDVLVAGVLGVGVVGQEEPGRRRVPVEAALQDGGRPGHRHLVLGVGGLKQELAGLDAVLGHEGGVEGDGGHRDGLQGLGQHLKVAR